MNKEGRYYAKARSTAPTQRTTVIRLTTQIYPNSQISLPSLRVGATGRLQPRVCAWLPSVIQGRHYAKARSTAPTQRTTIILLTTQIYPTPQISPQPLRVGAILDAPAPYLLGKIGPPWGILLGGCPLKIQGSHASARDCPYNENLGYPSDHTNISQLPDLTPAPPGRGTRASPATRLRVVALLIIVPTLCVGELFRMLQRPDKRPQSGQDMLPRRAWER
jgi:hypothetical protein